MHRVRIEVVRDRATHCAARLVDGAEHEVVDEQLRASVEELGQRLGPVVCLEAVLLLDRHPGRSRRFFVSSSLRRVISFSSASSLSRSACHSSWFRLLAPSSRPSCGSVTSSRIGGCQLGLDRRPVLRELAPERAAAGEHLVAHVSDDEAPRVISSMCSRACGSRGGARPPRRSGMPRRSAGRRRGRPRSASRSLGVTGVGDHLAVALDPQRERRRAGG